MLNRLSDYKAKQAKEEAPEDAAYICDLEQNAAFASSGWLCPPLATHGTIYNLQTKMTLEPEEHMSQMGEAWDEGTSKSDWQCCYKRTLKHLIRTPKGKQDVVKLAGNGQMMRNFGQFFLYCLSNFEV